MAYAVAARVFAIALGAAAIVWGVFVLPIFWAQWPVERTASRIINGEPFQLEALVDQAANLRFIEDQSPCNPSGLRSSVILRVQLVEQATLAGERTIIDEQTGALANALRRALACTPSDSYLWFIRFWLENNQNGFRPDHIKYLRMSYQLGPNEGWIALKRNHLAIALFSQLPADLSDVTVGEFARLVDNGVYSPMVAVLTGPGWPIRDRLLAALDNVSDINRRGFAAALQAGGFDVTIPNLSSPNRRPWQH